MKEEQTRDIESSEYWDYDSAELKPAVKKGRVVVSVSFPREDFEVVSDAAERAGMRVSEFIRTAALDKASGRAEIDSFEWLGSTAGTFYTSARLKPSTRASGLSEPEQMENFAA